MWKKNVTTLLLMWISAMIVLVWPHRVRHSSAWYEGGARDVSLTSAERKRSFLLTHFPLAIKLRVIFPCVFNVCVIGNVVHPFAFYIGNLCLLFFSKINLPSTLSLSFSKWLISLKFFLWFHSLDFIGIFLRLLLFHWFLFVSKNFSMFWA